MTNGVLRHACVKCQATISWERHDLIQSGGAKRFVQARDAGTAGLHRGRAAGAQSGGCVDLKNPNDGVINRSRKEETEELD